MSQVVHESVQSVFKVGMKLEVVDKMRISQVRVSRMSSRVTNTVTCTVPGAGGERGGHHGPAAAAEL